MISLEDRLAKLERLVETQQATIEAKDREIARLQARVAELERRLGENSSNSSKPPSSDSWLPARLGLRPRYVHTFEQHREFVHVDRDALGVRGHPRRKCERPALKPLVNDGETAARPRDQLHLVLAPVHEHEQVSAQRVVAERVPDRIRQAVERQPKVRRLDREVHADRARQQDHGCDLVSSVTIAATKLGEAFAMSIAILFGNRTVIGAVADESAPITVAGISDSDVAGEPRVASSTSTGDAG